jgi:hypothetical protein
VECSELGSNVNNYGQVRDMIRDKKIEPFKHEDDLEIWIKSDPDYLYHSGMEFRKYLKTRKVSSNFVANITNKFFGFSHFLVKHAAVASIVFIISLTTVGVSAAEIFAPDQYKPSKQIENLFKTPEENTFKPLEADDNNNVISYDSCDLAIKYPKIIDQIEIKAYSKEVTQAAKNDNIQELQSADGNSSQSSSLLNNEGQIESILLAGVDNVKPNPSNLKASCNRILDEQEALTDTPTNQDSESISKEDLMAFTGWDLTDIDIKDISLAKLSEEVNLESDEAISPIIIQNQELTFKHQDFLYNFNFYLPKYDVNGIEPRLGTISNVKGLFINQTKIQFNSLGFSQANVEFEDYGLYLDRLLESERAKIDSLDDSLDYTVLSESVEIKNEKVVIMTGLEEFQNEEYLLLTPASGCGSEKTRDCQPYIIFDPELIELVRGEIENSDDIFEFSGVVEKIKIKGNPLPYLWNILEITEYNPEEEKEEKSSSSKSNPSQDNSNSSSPVTINTNILNGTSGFGVSVSETEAGCSASDGVTMYNGPVGNIYYYAIVSHKDINEKLDFQNSYSNAVSFINGSGNYSSSVWNSFRKSVRYGCVITTSEQVVPISQSNLAGADRTRIFYTMETINGSYPEPAVRILAKKGDYVVSIKARPPSSMTEGFINDCNGYTLGRTNSTFLSCYNDKLESPSVVTIMEQLRSETLARFSFK